VHHLEYTGLLRQYHTYRCPGGICCQGICRYDIDPTPNISYINFCHLSLEFFIIDLKTFKTARVKAQLKVWVFNRKLCGKKRSNCLKKKNYHKFVGMLDCHGLDKNDYCASLSRAGPYGGVGVSDARMPATPHPGDCTSFVGCSDTNGFCNMLIKVIHNK